MKKRYLKKALAAVLSAAMILTSSASANPAAAAKKNVSLNTSFKTLKEGQKDYKLKLVNNTAGWKIKKVSTSDKKVVMVYGKTASRVLLKGRKEGRATVKVKIQTSQRKKNNSKTLKCRVKVVPESNVSKTEEAADTSDSQDVITASSVSVATQGELTAALEKKSYSSIVVKTDASEKFIIPEGTYRDTELTVDAPNSDFTNYGVFKSVVIHAIKSNTWTENVSGNTIAVKAVKARIIVARDAKIKNLSFVTAGADVKLQMDGTVSAISVEEKMNLAILGSSTAVLPVSIASAAGNASITSSVPMNVTSVSDAELTFEKGAEGSSVHITLASSAVKVHNKTKQKIEVTKADNKKVIVYADRNILVTFNTLSPAYGTGGQGAASSGTGGTIQRPSGGTGSSTDQPSGSTGSSTEQPSGGTGSETEQPSGSTGSETEQPSDGTGSSTDQPSGEGTDKPEEETDNSVVTRGKWIMMLAEMIGMNLEADLSSIDCYYADTKNSDYGVVIETAQKYHLLPEVKLEDEHQDVPFFYPEEAVTREFAAYTVIAAMGYSGSSKSGNSWDDWGDITYKDAAVLAVEQGFIGLKDNKFLPASPLTGSQAKKIQERIQSLNASVTLTEADIHDDSIYTESVMEEAFDSVQNYKVAENTAQESYKVTMNKNEIPEDVAAGSIIILPQTEDYPFGLALKVTAVQDAGGNAVYTCEVPKLEEVYTKIDLAGHAVPLIEKIKGSNDVNVTFDQDIALNSYKKSVKANIGAGGSTSIPGKFKFDIPKAGIKISDNLKLKGSVEVEIPDITCIVNADAGLLDGFSLNELTFSITEKVGIKEQLELLAAESGYELTNSNGNTRFEAGRIEIGRIPFAIGTTGLSSDLVFFANVSAKGTVSISYTFTAQQGFQFKDGAFRWIKDFSDSLDILQVKGSASATLGIALDLCAFQLMDLIGVSLEGGVGLNASFTEHILDDGNQLYCSDLTFHPILKAALDPETAAGKFLKTVWHITIEYDFLDESNPFAQLHIENGIVVEKCTYGKGTLTGKVEALNTGEAVIGARVQIYDQTGRLVQTSYTSADGSYTINNLDEAVYHMDISANGYQRYTTEIKIQKNIINYAETAIMVSRTSVTGVLSGKIIDAATGSAVTGAAFSIRDGWNLTTGDPVKQGILESEQYELELEAGNYTLLVEKEGYIPNLINIAIEENVRTLRDITLAPSDEDPDNASNIRIVLTWGEYPYDLDSHLFGPAQSNDGSKFHTYYVYKNYQYGDEMIANLDLDDVTSYGPETTTIYKRNKSSQYSFFVHDFTNRSSTSSKAMAQSGAQVQVFTGNTLRQTFNIPVNEEGTVWHVFDYDASSDTITPVNTFRYSSDPGSLAAYSLSAEDMMLQELSDLPEK